MAFPNQITTNPNLTFGEIPIAFPLPNGVLETAAATRYAPLIDFNAPLHIRMCKSVDSGTAWAEMDAANAPVVPADGAGGSGWTEVYQFINACMDPATKIIYSCYFDPGTFNIALAPFDTVTDKWLPSIVSTLSYLPQAQGESFTFGSFVTVFRPVDKAVWIWFYAGSATANDAITVWGAKCLVTVAGTGTWDLALTPMAGTPLDGIAYSQGGAGIDNGGNIHYWIVRRYVGLNATAHLTVDGLGNINGYVIDTGGAGFRAAGFNIPVTQSDSLIGAAKAEASVDGGSITALDISSWIGQAWNPAIDSISISASPNNYQLVHYVLHPDDSIAGPQLVVNGGITQIIQTSAINCTPGNTLLSTYQIGPSTGATRHILRAIAGDAPVWEDLAPAQIQEPSSAVCISIVHSAITALDYVVFAIRSTGLPPHLYSYFYATSTGIGNPFSAPVLIGTEPGGVNSAGGDLVAGIFDDLGLIFPFGPGGVFGAIGMGFWELSVGPPPVVTATLTLAKTVSPGGQAIATDFILSASGPVDISGAGGVGPSVVSPGVYNLAETPVAGYQSAGWSLAGGGTLVGNILTLAAGDVAIATIINNPVQKPTAGGGVYFPRFLNKTLLANQIAHTAVPAPLYWLYDFPNDFDVCLSREWRLYNQIDPTLLSCARKPDCFCGEQGSRPWVEPPSGAVTFNPDKAIPLPAPAAVDVVVLSFRVPIAYDGIILAQYHAYRGQGTFVEASGDIVWRVSANGRYLRDMGNMQVSIGSPQTLSPCPGGLWLHSGDLVEYVVSAPNGSGALPLPGQGFILAGLHGWFWPRT